MPSDSKASSGQALALHLVEEISHRVVNEYSEAISILSSGIRAGAQAGSTLGAAIERLRAHAEAHRALLVPITEGPVELGAHVRQLCRALDRASMSQRGVRLTVSSEEEMYVSSHCGWRVGLILTELLRNAVRHGLAGRQGAVEVTLKAHAGQICCVVEDTGRAPSAPNEGRGVRLIRTLVSELGGSIDWRFSEHGSSAVLIFPKKAAAAPGNLARVTPAA